MWRGGKVHIFQMPLNSDFIEKNFREGYIQGRICLALVLGTTCWPWTLVIKIGFMPGTLPLLFWKSPSNTPRRSTRIKMSFGSTVNLPREQCKNCTSFLVPKTYWARYWIFIQPSTSSDVLVRLVQSWRFPYTVVYGWRLPILALWRCKSGTLKHWLLSWIMRLM